MKSDDTSEDAVNAEQVGEKGVAFADGKLTTEDHEASRELVSTIRRCETLVLANRILKVFGFGYCSPTGKRANRVVPTFFVVTFSFLFDVVLLRLAALPIREFFLASLLGSLLVGVSLFVCSEFYARCRNLLESLMWIRLFSEQLEQALARQISRFALFRPQVIGMIGVAVVAFAALKMILVTHGSPFQRDLTFAFYISAFVLSLALGHGAYWAVFGLVLSKTVSDAHGTDVFLSPVKPQSSILSLLTATMIANGSICIALVTTIAMMGVFSLDVDFRKEGFGYLLAFIGVGYACTLTFLIVPVFHVSRVIKKRKLHFLALLETKMTPLYSNIGEWNESERTRFQQLSTLYDQIAKSSVLVINTEFIRKVTASFLLPAVAAYVGSLRWNEIIAQLFR